MEKRKELEPFSARLKGLRIEKGATQKEMAALLGKTERHYQDIEAGKINIPILALVALAEYFHVSTDYLLGRSDLRL